MRYQVFVSGVEPNTFSVFKHTNESIARQVLRGAKLLGFTAFVIITPL